MERFFESVDALARESEQNLKKGRTFVPGASGVEARQPCDLVLRHPETGAGLRVPAEAVWVDGAGVGFELTDLDEPRLDAFVASGVGDEDLALPPGVVPLDADDAEDAADEDAASDENGEDDAGPSSTSGQAGRRAPRNVHERVRQLSSRDQIVMARSGTLTERIALERCYGNTVWEPLLQNPQITPPEVARIAKKGSVPKPLINTIVSNAAWLTHGEVQRALLTNPRVSGMHLTKVLRALPHGDLVRVPKQTAYRAQVREAARKMLGQ